MEEKLYIKFKEGDTDSLNRACREAERLGYAPSPLRDAFYFKGHGILSLHKDRFYNISSSGEKELIDKGYEEHKIQDEFVEGERVLVRDSNNRGWDDRIYLTTVPGLAKGKYIVVARYHEKGYKNGEEFDTVIYKQIKKKEETIEINGKKYRKQDIEDRLSELEPLE